jgi:meso-butanediol dehydrogenase/(S,S)-butanediol dehydrogenase/diacetyl reductase
MEQRFKHKTVIVTGAAGNIGEGVVRRFSAEGANVVLAARTTAKLEALAAELDPQRTLSVTTDVTSQPDIQAMAQAAVDRFGTIDVLVSNAGVGIIKPFEELTLDDWQANLDVNLTSAFLGAQACLPHLKTTKGCIVHNASASGLGGDPGMTPYNAAKAGLINFTRGLAFDLGPYGIRVNAVAPSMTLPEGVSHPMLTPEFLNRFQDRRALAGHSTPDDIGAAMTFLASSDARFITGVTLPIDGGITASSGQPRF